MSDHALPPFQVIRSKRRTVAIEITVRNEVIVRAPQRMSQSEVERFVQSKASWLQKHLADRDAVPPPFTEEERRALIAEAKQALPPLVARLAPLVGVDCPRVSVRTQRTRWGSCSAKGTIQLNALLMLVPSDVREYVVVHELCHRKEMNHSRRFWAAVAAVLPSYAASRAWLKEHGAALIARLPNNTKNEF